MELMNSNLFWNKEPFEKNRRLRGGLVLGGGLLLMTAVFSGCGGDVGKQVASQNQTGTGDRDSLEPDADHEPVGTIQDPAVQTEKGTGSGSDKTKGTGSGSGGTGDPGPGSNESGLTDSAADGMGKGSDSQYMNGTGNRAEESTVSSGIRLVMIGDMLMHMSVVRSGEQPDGSYDYRHLFAEIDEEIQNADLAIVNQETILGGKELGFSGYPNFNSPYELGDAEAEAGFDVVLHATNHALDKNKSGLMNCITFWKTQHPEVAYLGINESQEQQDDDIFLYENNGLTIAILNYTYGTNGISTPRGMPFAVNYLDEDKVVSDIAKAHTLADFVVVCPHWGTEYNHGIDSYQEKWTRLFLEKDVALVIGTHPHVIEPIEMLEDTDGDQMLVYYSLGNYVNGTSSSGKVADRMVGGMAQVEIGRDENGEAVIMDYGVEPLVCHIAEGSDYTVYPLAQYTKELADENRIRRQASNFSLEYCKDLVHEVWGELKTLSPENWKNHFKSKKKSYG